MPPQTSVKAGCRSISFMRSPEDYNVSINLLVGTGKNVTCIKNNLAAIKYEEPNFKKLVKSDSLIIRNQ